MANVPKSLVGKLAPQTTALLGGSRTLKKCNLVGGGEFGENTSWMGITEGGAGGGEGAGTLSLHLSSFLRLPAAMTCAVPHYRLLPLHCCLITETEAMQAWDQGL